MMYYVELENGYLYLKVGRLYPIDDRMMVRDESGYSSDLDLLHGENYSTVVVEL